MHSTAVNRVYLAQYIQRLLLNDSFETFSLDSSISYQGYCDDFGPMNMSCIIDFIRLLDEQGPPPQVIWLRLGNCSNTALQEVLATTLLRAMDHLREREPWVEIRPNQQS